MSADVARKIFGAFLAFMAVNAFAGGYYGIAGARGVPTEWLANSPFKDYLIPSLILFAVIGGLCLWSSIAVFRCRPSARRLSIWCGIVLIVWIVVQVGIIGFVSWMQPAVALAGALITVIAFRIL